MSWRKEMVKIINQLPDVGKMIKGISPATAPINSKTPFLLYSLTGSKPSNNMTSAADLDFITVRIEIKDKEMEVCEQIGRLLRKNLDNLRPTNPVIKRIVRVDERDGFDENNEFQVLEQDYLLTIRLD